LKHHANQHFFPKPFATLEGFAFLDSRDEQRPTLP